MMDPRWDNAYIQAWSALTEAWEYRLVVSGVITSICTVFGMDEALVYCMFITLTADMFFRFCVLARLNGITGNITICHGMKKGMPRYIHYCTFIAMAWAAQLSLGQATGIRFPVIDLMMCYLVLQDLASITGSLHALGVRIPGILHRAIRRGRRHIDQRVDDFATGEDNGCMYTPETPPEEAREPYTPAEHPHRRISDRKREGYQDTDTE